MRRAYKPARHSGGVTLSMFSEVDLDDMHIATAEVLERAGVAVESDEACDIYADGGCRVDRETHIVRIPQEAVAKALSTTPRSFRMFARDPERDVLIEPDRTVISPFAEGLMVNDLESGENRIATKQDNADINKVADALEQIDIGGVHVTPRDMPEATATVHALETAFSNTTKPLVSGMPSKEQVELAHKMCVAVCGSEDEAHGRPLIVFAGCPVAPLTMTAEWTEGVVAAARHGYPINSTSMGMAGGSTPITLAGTLVVQNAEELASLVLTQLVNPGNAFFYSSSTCSLDMRWGTATVGTPEMALYQAGTAALARYYGVPSWTAGY
jgi:trimethylamine---corrinoid protein Co-methyltransferase